jgi:hypothetical protein
MKTFQEFKTWIIEQAKLNNACYDGLSAAINTTTYNELLLVVKNYSNWIYRTNIINTETILEVPDEELVLAGIYVNKKGIIQKENFCVYYSSTSEHYGSSTSRHYDSSTSRHYGSSTSEHYGSSTSRHYDSSTSEHYGSSTSEHYDSSYSSVYELKDKSILNDSSVIRERSTGNLYFIEDKFNVVIL